MYTLVNESPTKRGTFVTKPETALVKMTLVVVHPMSSSYGPKTALLPPNAVTLTKNVYFKWRALLDGLTTQLAPTSTAATKSLGAATAFPTPVSDVESSLSVIGHPTF